MITEVSHILPQKEAVKGIGARFNEGRKLRDGGEKGG